MRTKNRRGTVAVGALLTSVALLAGACSKASDPPQASAVVVTDDDGATSATSPAGANDSDSGSTKGNADVNVDGLSLPRKVTYTGLEFTLTKATPSTDKESEKAGVSLDVTVRNTTTAEAQFDGTWVSLVESDGTRQQANGVYDTDRGLTQVPVYMVASGKVERTFFVPVEGSLKVADTKLSVAKLKGIPAETPLTGPETKSAFPLDFAVPTDPISFTGYSPITVTLKSGQVVEEALGKRADKGKHFVVIVFKVAEDPCGCGGAIVGKETVNLVIDGTPTEAVEQDPSGCCLLDVGVAKDLTEVYELPDNHKSVSLVVEGTGEKPNQTRPLAITLPALPSASGSSASGAGSTTSTTRPS